MSTTNYKLPVPPSPPHCPAGALWLATATTRPPGRTTAPPPAPTAQPPAPTTLPSTRLAPTHRWVRLLLAWERLPLLAAACCAVGAWTASNSSLRSSTRCPTPPPFQLHRWLRARWWVAPTPATSTRTSAPTSRPSEQRERGGCDCWPAALWLPLPCRAPPPRLPYPLCSEVAVDYNAGYTGALAGLIQMLSDGATTA